MKEAIKKYKVHIVVVIIVVLLCIYFRPMPLLEEKKEITLVTILSHNWDDGYVSYSLNSAEGHSDEIDKFYEIVQEYRIHRALPKMREIFGSDLYTNGNSISIHTPYDSSVMISDTGDVFVDNRRYRFDYFGDKKAEELYARLEAFVKELETLEVE